MCRLSALTDRDKKAAMCFVIGAQCFCDQKAKKRKKKLERCQFSQIFLITDLIFTRESCVLFFFSFLFSALAKASIQMANQNSTNPRTDRRRTLRFQKVFPKEIFIRTLRNLQDFNELDALSGIILYFLFLASTWTKLKKKKKKRKENVSIQYSYIIKA